MNWKKLINWTTLLFKGWFTLRQQSEDKNIWEDEQYVPDTLQARLLVEVHGETVNVGWVCKDEQAFADLFFDLTNGNLNSFIFDNMATGVDQQTLELIAALVTLKANETVSNIQAAGPVIKPSDIFDNFNNKIG